MKRGAVAILITLLTVIVAIIIFLIAVVASAFTTANSCMQEQYSRLDMLRAEYARDDFKGVDEREFCDFDLDAALQKDIKLIDLQFLATHNSYKKQKAPLERFYSKFSKSLERGSYYFETPTDQLNAGIRSLEFDLYAKQGKNGVTFHSFHIGYVDVSSNAFDFAACLEEIDLWSKSNPNHLPISIIIELKERGDMFTYKALTERQLADLDALIKEKCSTLYLPSEAFDGYDNLNEMRANDDSPTLRETMGKVLFILHRGELTEKYIASDTSYKSQAMFPSSYFWYDKVVGIHQFVIVNNHGYYEGSIDENGGRKNKYFFRIMLDNDDCEQVDARDLENAIATGATICSTNRPPVLNPRDGYESVLFAPNGKTVRLVGDVVL